MNLDEQVSHMMNELEPVQDTLAKLVALYPENLSYADLDGRFFFHVMASLAQMERELIVERPRAGLDAARRQGRVGDAGVR
jgi:DNA invertase Pin-like site-specific DNA recombinase